MARVPVLLLTAVSLLACSRRPRPPRPDFDTAENQAIMAKVDSYLDCLADHSARVFRIADLYRERVRGGRPATPTEVVLRASGDPAECVAAIAVARTRTPRLVVLDDAADLYGRALVDVFNLTTAGQGYLEPTSASYDPVRVLGLHARLMSVFARFDVAQAALFDEVYRLNRTVHLDQFASRQAKEGRKIPILTEAVLLAAEDLVRFAATPSEQLAGLDLAAFATQLAGLDNILEELRAYLSEHPEEAKANQGMMLFLERAGSYATAAKQLVQRVRAGVAYSDAEQLMIRAGNEGGIPGTPAAMITAYNQLAKVL